MSQDVETAASKAAPGGAPPAARLAAGTTVGGRFEIEAAAGQTIFAELYHANDRETGHPVTVHLLHAPLAANQKLVDVILARAEKTGALDQRNIARTITAG